MKPIAQREAWIPFTKAGYQKILDEKVELLSQRPEAVDHLKKAREMGDLSENGYYKASRARLSFLDARIRRVERLIRLGKIVEAASNDYVQIGTNVTVSDGLSTYTYSIVGGYESDPSKHSISHLSPLGKSLTGKKVQDIVSVQTPKGTRSYTIVKIEPL